MVDFIGLLVGLLAIIQFLLKTEKWTLTWKIPTLVILGAVSIMIFSFNGSTTSMASANPPTSATATPKEQTDTNVTDGQPYSIYRSDKFVSLKRGKHYPYICNPEINNCLGFTMKFSYQLQGGNYAKNVWLVCVRENGDEWVQVDEITINEGEEKEFVIQFDKAISFTEIVIQRPIDYNNYMHTDSLSIYDIVYN